VRTRPTRARLVRRTVRDMTGRRVPVVERLRRLRMRDGLEGLSAALRAYAEGKR